MSAQPAVLQVVILRDGLLVGTEVFVPGQYVLGSADYAELRLDDATVDATHANLFFQNGKVAIQDAGSSSGVFVNMQVDADSSGPSAPGKHVRTQSRKTDSSVASTLRGTESGFTGSERWWYFPILKPGAPNSGNP